MIVDEAERWKAADLKEVVAYLAAPAPATVLALVAEEIKSDAALVKAVAKAGQVLHYDVTKRKLPDWVAEQFARAGAKAEPTRVARSSTWSATISTSSRARPRSSRPGRPERRSRCEMSSG